MKRFVLSVLAVAMTIAAAYAQAPSVLGPASQTLARIYFYRLVGSNLFPRWTSVSFDDSTVGNIGPGEYFYRDVPPATYRIGVSSDVPYSDQYESVTVTPNSTTYIRVFDVPGYGITFNGGGLNSAPSVHIPSVFGNRVMDPDVARREMVGLTLGR